jgi:hypothetical protein
MLDRGLVAAVPACPSARIASRRARWLQSPSPKASAAEGGVKLLVRFDYPKAGRGYW